MSESENHPTAQLGSCPMMQTVAVLRSDDFVVTEGVAEGEGITFADELVMDDVYQLSASAARHPLTLCLREDASGFEVSAGSPVGKAGNAVVFDSCVTLMASDSETFEVLILVEIEDGGLEATYLLPLSTLAPAATYRLVGVDQEAVTARFEQVATVSFARCTRITMATGEQRPIEALSVGDKVMTRDAGPQEVRWIGQSKLRAEGDFAPIVIAKGALHNENDLLVSPDHRLFIYQRKDALGAGRSEVLVKVRHLINGDSVYRQEGGVIDYFQLLFDAHQIVYAEGIAAESVLVDPRTRTTMTNHAKAKQGRRNQHDYEVQEKLLQTSDAVSILRKASLN